MTRANKARPSWHSRYENQAKGGNVRRGAAGRARVWYEQKKNKGVERCVWRTRGVPSSNTLTSPYIPIDPCADTTDWRRGWDPLRSHGIKQNCETEPVRKEQSEHVVRRG